MCLWKSYYWNLVCCSMLLLLCLIYYQYRILSYSNVMVSYFELFNVCQCIKCVQYDKISCIQIWFKCLMCILVDEIQMLAQKEHFRFSNFSIYAIEYEIYICVYNVYFSGTNIYPIHFISTNQLIIFGFDLSAITNNNNNNQNKICFVSITNVNSNKCSICTHVYVHVLNLGRSAVLQFR